MSRINVTKSSMPSFDEYIEEIKPLWTSRWLSNSGELHNKLEQQLESYLDVNNVSLFNNGHMALYTAIKSLNLTGEVITTPFTFVSTTHAIVQNGLTPVFCDINPNDFTIDVSKIEKLITDKTSAIVAVHVYGNICDVEKIKKIAKKYNLKVIYDAAHAFGVKYKQQGIGNFGDISMMSFHATKVFHTIEGGALLYNENSMKDKISSMRNFGFTSAEECKYVAMNTKMNEFQAAMGICNLKNIDAEIQKRKKVVQEYNKRLNGIDGIKLWLPQKDITPNYIYYPIIINKNEFGIDRDELCDVLKTYDIIPRKYFYPLTCDFDCYKNIECDVDVARDIASKVLTLPLYADLTIDEIDKICNIIKECKR